MEKGPKIIVLTGPESTGKTFLSKGLAKFYNTVWIPEYAREYIDKLNRPYVFSDLENIARKQVMDYDTIKSIDRKFVFLDTFLIITRVWFLEVYDNCPEWINDELDKFEPGLFLLCNFDLPWEEDPLRENRTRREYLFNRYIRELDNYNFPYKIISGGKTERLNNAKKIIQNII